MPDAGWGVVVSDRFSLEVPLPERAAWKVDDASERWFVATHVPTGSVLRLRTWREGSVVSRKDCEAAARSFRRDLFGEGESALEGRRPLGAPDGYDTEVGFAVERGADALGGIAAAAGANLRRCFAAVFTTSAAGVSAERVVGERLAFVTATVLARVRSRTIEDRVRPGAVEDPVRPGAIEDRVRAPSR